MTAQVESRVLDFGLNEISTTASHVVVCAAEPTVYSLCSVGAANALGYKSFGAGNAFGVPSDYSVNGRYVASTNITAPVIHHQLITCVRVGIQTNAHRIMTL
jgi:hypothetical protein